MQSTRLYTSHVLREDESESTFTQCQIISRKQWSDFNHLILSLRNFTQATGDIQYEQHYMYF